MSEVIVQNKGASTVYTIRSEGRLAKVTVPTADLRKTDPAIKASVDTSIKNMLSDNASYLTSNPSAAQTEANRIIDRSKINDPKYVGDEYENEKVGSWPAGAAELTNVSNPTDSPRKVGVYNNDSIVEKEVEPEKALTSDTKIRVDDASSNYSRGYFKSIGGADLSVFYMAEMPVMEDVLSKPEDPDTWRTELITIEMDNVLSLSYSTVRERFPIRQLGKANPVAYTSGIRTISGHIAFAVFAEDVLARLRTYVNKKFEQVTRGESRLNNATKDQQNLIFNNINKLKNYYTAALNMQSEVQLLDSIPPFHLLVMGINEAGVMSKLLLKNVYIVDEAQQQGTQQPHIINKVYYNALDIVPMVESDVKNIFTGSMDSITEQYQQGAYNLLSMPNLTGSSVLEEEIMKDLVSSTNYI